MLYVVVGHSFERFDKYGNQISWNWSGLLSAHASREAAESAKADLEAVNSMREEYLVRIEKAVLDHHEAGLDRLRRGEPYSTAREDAELDRYHETEVEVLSRFKQLGAKPEFQSFSVRTISRAEDLLDV